jgi:hypothetical protein
MQQSAYDILLISTIPHRESCRLEAMGEAIHGKATVISIEQFEVTQNPLRGPGREFHMAPADDHPILNGALIHPVKFRSRFFSHKIPLTTV